jgi:hypothetical protein
MHQASISKFWHTVSLRGTVQASHAKGSEELLASLRKQRTDAGSTPAGRKAAESAARRQQATAEMEANVASEAKKSTAVTPVLSQLGGGSV